MVLPDGASGAVSVFEELSVCSINLVHLLFGDVGGWTGEYELARVQAQDAVGVAAGQANYVQADDHGDLFLAGDIAEESKNVPCEAWVQGGNWFVGQDQSRLLHQCAGNGDALLLTAAQAPARLFGLVRQAYPVQQFKSHAPLALLNVPRMLIGPAEWRPPVSTFVRAVSRGTRLKC